MVDFGRLIATKILRYHSHGTQLGLVLHLINGVLLAIFFAMFVVHWLPGPFLVRGLIYGFALWLIMMAAMPLLGDDLFASRAWRSTVFSALLVHLLYGIVVGLSVSI
jgi:hypothetical protein